MGLVEFFQFAFDDLRDRLRRLAFDLFGGDFLFLVEVTSGWDFAVRMDAVRIAGRRFAR